MTIINEVSELVKKNLRTLLRTKAGSLIVILGPLLIIFLAGLAFDNSSLYSVKIGTYAPSETNDVTSIIDQLNEEFNVIQYNDEQTCIDAIKNTDINTCLVFTDEFTIGKKNNNDISFHVDYSRINLVWTITSVITKRVGEQRLEASQDLTKILLDTIEYTEDRIGDQRDVVVKLTTENELILRNTQDLMAELSDIDLSFDDNALPLENLTRANTQVKQWVDNALNLGTKGINKASTFIDAAYDLAKGSGGDQLQETFQKTIDDMNKLEADMATTKEVTQESFDDFSNQIERIKKGIVQTKERLNEADTSRQLSLRVLEAVTNLLDNSLLSILHVQNALNDIENKINTIEITDPEAITQPIVTNIKPLVEEKTYLNYLFPVLIVLVIMFTALLITPTLILLEKHSPAHIRTFMTPVKDASYLLATFITASIILLVQVFIILAITSVFFTERIVTNVPEAILILLVTNSLFILIGMIVGYLFNSEETAILAGISTGAIFLFLSDVIIPIESMPEAFSAIANFNPYVIGSSLLRRALLFDASFLSLATDFIILLGYIIAASLIAAGTYLMTRHYSLAKILKKLQPVLQRMSIKNLPFKKK